MNIEEIKVEGLRGDDKLPQEWAIATVKEFCKIQTGKKDVNQGNPNGQYYFFTCASEPLRSDDYIFDGQSILLPGNGANVGLVVYYKGKFDLYQRTYALTNFLINGKYLYFYFLANWKNSLIDKQYGSATNYIRLGNITEFSIPIAPLNEQKRIVEKLEKLLAKVNDSCDRLSRIPTILKRFRQSVLASACSGRLTADWRKQHPNIEPAEELLKKDTGNDINELPQSWCFVSVGDVITELKYGTSKKCSYDKQSHSVLRIPNVVQGVIDCSDLKYTELSDKEYETLRLKIGDILMIRSNGSVSLIGKTAMVTQSEEGFAYAGYLIRLRPNLSMIDPGYLNYYLSSYEIRLQIELPARSTSGVNNINSTEVKKLAIAVPPLQEQKEIVRRVQALFKKCNLIEQKYLKAKTYTDKLTQSILAKAFRGELVPQDPNDEPAEVLLERIREEKALTEKSSKGKKRSKSKTT